MNILALAHLTAGRMNVPSNLFDDAASVAAEAMVRAQRSFNPDNAKGATERTWCILKARFAIRSFLIDERRRHWTVPLADESDRPRYLPVEYDLSAWPAFTLAMAKLTPRERDIIIAFATGEPFRTQLPRFKAYAPALIAEREGIIIRLRELMMPLSILETAGVD